MALRNFTNITAITLAATALVACNEKSTVQTYDMPSKQLYAKLKHPTLLKSVRPDKGYSEVGKRRIVDKKHNEYITWAYVHNGMEHYWYTAQVEAVDENRSTLKLEFFPSAHLAKMPQMSMNMMYAASAEAVRAHLEGRPIDGQKIMQRSAIFIVSNPVKSYSEIARIRQQAITQAKKKGVM